jgi:hypothetical protein
MRPSPTKYIPTATIGTNMPIKVGPEKSGPVAPVAETQKYTHGNAIKTPMTSMPRACRRALRTSGPIRALMPGA